jgi:hypothetical protein
MNAAVTPVFWATEHEQLHFGVCLEYQAVADYPLNSKYRRQGLGEVQA